MAGLALVLALAGAWLFLLRARAARHEQDETSAGMLRVASGLAFGVALGGVWLMVASP